MLRLPTPLLATLLLLTTAVGVVYAADDYPLVPAVECTPRNGLPNFIAKATAGETLKIGYLGGSITAQPGWRPKSLKWLQEQFPKAKLSEINAAIGGTGSDLGVFRLKQDVLDYQPDLLFVEFAVNDGGAAPEQIERCMEGIVRQTFAARPACDVCFVYTLVEGFAPTLQQGKFPRAASVMEKIAGHYGIPSIHMGLEVANLAKEGKLIFKGKRPGKDAAQKQNGDKIIFSEDGVHPFPETGHERYLASIQRSWPKIAAAPGKAGDHTLSDPFRKDNYEKAKLLPIDAPGVKLSSGFRRLEAPKDGLAKSFGNRLSHLYRADQAGESITFKFKGTRCAIYDIVGPDCGQVIVTIDDAKPQIRPRFDAYCTYHRLQTLTLGTELPDAVHTVKIEVHPDQPDKAKILSQRNEKIDKPERFDGKAYYPGAILVVGEVVE